ncbi:hypothetical protein M408DRAFT_146609 [Serendipita vermifera MAFF 305830]|uniref:Uncharacterized protein n=1 Tax=Serendipita vermifera MAFF 305830 TaxID=933852 RepID=A0A0C2XFW0_SERVB|nr:hypothetical protein M408DRAFT_146609 [Serendipita vermifera MAFF 305830]
MEVEDAPLGRFTFFPRIWSISASISSIVSRLLLPIVWMWVFLVARPLQILLPHQNHHY